MIMAPNITHYISVFSMLICFSFLSHSQVGINTDNPVDGTVLDISSSDKGVLFPRIELQSTINQLPVVGNLTDGTLIYNTETNGSGDTAVYPGYYYWVNNKWRRMSVDSYTVQWNQTNGITATTNSFTTLPNLDQTITAPFTGTYRIIVTAYINPGTFNGVSSNPQGLQGSFKLEQNNIKIAENLVTTTSVQSAQRLPQQSIIIINRELIAGNSYNFKVSGREWRRTNGLNPSEFGNTHNYAGSSGVRDAVLGSMTITLINSY